MILQKDREEYYAQLSDRLKTVRKQNHYTQDEFAKLIGLTRAAYAHIESGSVAISVHAIKIISEHFDVSYKELIDGPSPKPKPITKNDKNALQAITKLAFEIIDQATQ